MIQELDKITKKGIKSMQDTVHLNLRTDAHFGDPKYKVTLV